MIKCAVRIGWKWLMDPTVSLQNYELTRKSARDWKKMMGSWPSCQQISRGLLTRMCVSVRESIAPEQKPINSSSDHLERRDIPQVLQWLFQDDALCLCLPRCAEAWRQTDLASHGCAARDWKASELSPASCQASRTQVSGLHAALSVDE